MSQKAVIGAALSKRGEFPSRSDVFQATPKVFTKE